MPDSSSSTPTRPRDNWRHYAWVIVAVGTLGVFGSLGLARMGYSIILPSMQAGLKLDNTHAGALSAANLVGYLVLAVLGGMLAARFGARYVIAFSIALIGVAMLMTGFARTFAEAMIWRTLTGIGSGSTNVPVMGLISGWFAPRKRGLAAGIGVSGSSLALISTGPLVPYVLSIYGPEGWRTCWFILGGVTVLIAVVALVLLRNHPSDAGLHPYGSETAEAVASPAQTGLQWGAVYRSKHIWHLGFVYIAYGLAYMIYMTFFVKALIAQGGYTPKGAGNLFMTMGWFSLLAGSIWGTVSDVIGRKGALIVVYLIQAVSFGLFALLPTPLGFTLSAILFGITAWSIPAITAAACADMLGPRLAPAGLGFVTLFLGIGQAVGPMVAGAMADHYQSYLPAVLTAAIASVCGAIGAAFLKPTTVCE
ncbi:MAG: MFS transporter [Bacteroidota bacterium]